MGSAFIRGSALTKAYRRLFNETQANLLMRSYSLNIDYVPIGLSYIVENVCLL